LIRLPLQPPALAASLIVLAAGAAARSRLVPTRAFDPRTGSTTPWSAQRRSVRSLVDQVGHRWTTSRQRLPTDDELAAWCDDLARQLRTGSSLTAAICTAIRSPAVDTAIAPIVLGLQRGATLAGALGQVGRASPPLATVLGVLQACASLGGPSAAAIDRAAAALRRRSVDAAERRVHSAQARLSALVLTLLPGAVLVLTTLTSDTTRATLTTTSGLSCLVAGCLLNVVGWWWMQRIIRRSP
jgi:Flp pilus assembly protein TadB